MKKVMCGLTFRDVDLSDYQFDNHYFIKCKFINVNFRATTFHQANVRDSLFLKCDLSIADFCQATLLNVDFTDSNLSDANFTFAKIIQCNLSGTNLRDAVFEETVGLGTREQEIEFAKNLLKILSDSQNKLKMSTWHSCETSHCIAGWAFPQEARPGIKASMAYPTLAQYFNSDEVTARMALYRVAHGIESVFCQS